jgi:hypothetical protein
MLHLLEKICEMMNTLGIPYMLSGSVAMNVYAEPRTTQDIDIIVEMLLEDVPNLIKLLGDGFYFSEDAMYDAIERKSMFNIIDYSTGMKVDFILRNNDFYEQFKFQNRKKAIFEGVELWIISKEDLVLSKIRWIQELESEKQKSDIRNLLSTEALNMEYVLKWCELMNLKTFNLL